MKKKAKRKKALLYPYSVKRNKKAQPKPKVCELRMEED